MKNLDLKFLKVWAYRRQQSVFAVLYRLDNYCWAAEHTDHGGNRMIDDKTLYQLISQKTMSAESISWSRFHYFLVFNAILILAWTTVYSANPPVDGAAFVLPLICILGIISGLPCVGVPIKRLGPGPLCGLLQS